MSDEKKTKLGRKFHEPTEETKQIVYDMMICGITQEDIAACIGLTAVTLRTHYRDILDTAKAQAVTAIGKNLFEKAKNGDVASQIFYLKTQGKWSEKVQNEHSGEMTVNITKRIIDPKNADN